MTQDAPPRADLPRRIAAEIPRLRRYARSLCRRGENPDDLVQDCLARALAKLHLWQEGTDLRAWLCTILHNQHVNRIRRAVREGVSVEAEACDGIAPEMTTVPRQDLGILVRDLRASLAMLPEESRQIICLVANGWTYEAVADKLGVPCGTVRSRLSRGRAALRALMDGTYDGRSEMSALCVPDIAPADLDGALALSAEEMALLGRMR